MCPESELSLLQSLLFVSNRTACLTNHLCIVEADVSRLYGLQPLLILKSGLADFANNHARLNSVAALQMAL